MDANLRPVVSNGGRLPNTRIHGKITKEKSELANKNVAIFRVQQSARTNQKSREFSFLPFVTLEK